MAIEDYIPEGYENRVSRGFLQELLQMPDRAIRAEIEKAQDRGILIVSRDGGYFQRRDERDDEYIKDYMRAEDRRFRTMSHKNKRLREAWQRIHPAEKQKKQIPGQMSFIF